MVSGRVKLHGTRHSLTMVVVGEGDISEQEMMGGTGADRGRGGLDFFWRWGDIQTGGTGKREVVLWTFR